MNDFIYRTRNTQTERSLACLLYMSMSRHTINTVGVVVVVTGAEDMCA